MRRLFAAGLLLLFVVVAAAVPKCDPSVPVGGICRIKASQLKPTQFGFGRVASQCKALYLESMSSSKLEAYLQKEKHHVPVIRGWGGGYYATDHHHLSRALLDSHVPVESQLMYARIVADYSSLKEVQFWAKMISEGYVWLYDERGAKPVSPLHLGPGMHTLQNDFYRTLSYFVRTYGGFGKTNTSYSEFLWANWFRTNLPLKWPTLPSQDPSDPAHITDEPAPIKWNVCDVMPYEPPCVEREVSTLKNFMPQALWLASSTGASHLPGWGKGIKEEAPCNIDLIPQLDDPEEMANYQARSRRAFNSE